ncbi:MAG: hypothetical protein IT324_01610 [Anaerolineae bacterium]|nr:hypothetical protein [Anaerolineae bacterium]
MDDDGREQYIDFAQCYAYYVQKSTSPEYIERMKELNPQMQWDKEGINKYIQKRVAWREVALRNVLSEPWADGPYIEFYTEPRIRFKFSTQDEFYKVRYAIEQFGWRTFDLS